MSFSFTFPHKPLLHKRIEDQWFDKSPKETHSTLTALEAAEEAYVQKLEKITTPEHPPIVLGRVQHQNSLHQQQQQQARAAANQPQHQQQQPSEGQHRRRSRSSIETESHDQADDVSTVVNPRNRGSQQQQQQQQQQPPPQYHQETPHQAAMFWNRTRSRRSAGGDR